MRASPRTRYDHDQADPRVEQAEQRWAASLETPLSLAGRLQTVFLEFVAIADGSTRLSDFGEERERETETV
jgi:hypothetical protein